MRNFKEFSDVNEAIQWARQSVDEQAGNDSDYELKLKQIIEALESQSK